MSVDPGKGWRLLREGETIKPNDQFRARGDNNWEQTTRSGTQWHNFSHHPMRRRTQSANHGTSRRKKRP